MRLGNTSNYEARRQWIVIHLTGGVGNQLLQMVAGLMLALATDRLVAIDDRHRDAKHRGGHDFAFESVVKFPLIYNIKLPENTSRSPWTWTADTNQLEILLCSNLTQVFHEWDIVDTLFGQPPHILYRNPYHGEFLRGTFHGKPFFFLSHFVWIGDRVRRMET